MATELHIVRGDTFLYAVRWEQPLFAYKEITNIANSAPVLITAPSHEIPEGWRVAVQSVQGMLEINAGVEVSPLVAIPDEWFFQATVIDADTIELNKINALGFSTYLSGGVLVYRKPVNLTEYTGRMSIKDKIGGTEILSLTDANSRIIINPSTYVIGIKIEALDTAAIIPNKGVFDLELVHGLSGQVTKILQGTVRVTGEVTT